MQRVNQKGERPVNREEAAQAEPKGMPVEDTFELGVIRSQAAAVGAPQMSHLKEEPFPEVEFPNYFHTNDPEANKRIQNKVNQAIAAILTRLNVPYIDPSTDKLSHKGFFNALNAQIQAQDPGAKVYISGGVVRSLLSYIYKKVYGQHQRNSTPNTTEWVLNRIIKGPQQGEDILDSSDSESDAPTEGHPRDFQKLSALGIGSDLNILVEFSEDLPQEKKNEIIKQATSFINAAGEQILPEVDDNSVLKSSVVAVGDVKEYSTQNNSITPQSGSTLDYLAFPLSSQSGTEIRMPEKHQYIMNNFFNGKVEYLPEQQPGIRPKYSAQATTIRGLRPLLEIPFLHLTESGAEQLSKELQTLIDQLNNGSQLDAAAHYQFGQMMRNARFEGAHNRFHNADPISQLVLQISKLGKRKMPLVPEFTENKKIENRKLSKEAQNFTQYLTSFDTFKEAYADNGILYHGTPQIEYVLTMIRNGLMPSIPDRQGFALHGAGFYTAQERSVSKKYMGKMGAILKLPVNSNLRVLDLFLFRKENEIKYKELEEEARSAGVDINAYLAKKFQLDIICGDYPLVMNSAAVKLPKNIKTFTNLKLSPVKDMRDFLLLDANDKREFQSFYQLGSAIGIAHLPKLPDMKDAQEIAKYLADSEASVRQAAIQALVELKANTPEIQKQIVDYLTHKVPEVRQAAILALVELKAKTPELQEQIAERLGDLDASVRRTAINALVQLGGNNFSPQIAERFGDLDASVRRTAINALVQFGGNNFSPQIAERLGDLDASVRQASILALVKLKENTPELQEQIAGYLCDPDAGMRGVAKNALIQLTANTSEIIEQIAGYLNNTNPGVRLVAIEALFKLGGDISKIRATIKKCLSDSDKSVRIAANLALAQL